jgi:drug/metabolite transporter (DMT)-like permease
MVAVGLFGYGIYKNGWASVGANLASPEGLKYAALAGLAGVASNILLYTAMATAPAGLGFTLFNVMSTLGTAALGVLLLKEVITPIQAAGIGLALLSVVLITWKG